jgi:conjugal transfer/entry exclusion protein
MKKKIFLVVMLIVLKSGIFAQGYPVMDITNILTAIQNGYHLYQQLQTNINALRNAYEQLQQAVKSFQALDLSKLDAKDPLGSWRTIMTYANTQANNVKRIEGIMNAKNIKIGNNSWSLTDLYKVNPVKNAKDMFSAGANFVAVDPFEKELTVEQKAAFHSRYGMEPGNYLRFNQIREAIRSKAQEAVATLEDIEKEEDEWAKRIDNIAKESAQPQEEDSIVLQAQVTNALAKEQVQQSKQIGKTLAQLTANFGNYAAQSQEERESAQRSRNTNELDFAKSFTDMINGLPPDSDFSKGMRRD